MNEKELKLKNDLDKIKTHLTEILDNLSTIWFKIEETTDYINKNNCQLSQSIHTLLSSLTMCYIFLKNEIPKYIE